MAKPACSKNSGLSVLRCCADSASAGTEYDYDQVTELARAATDGPTIDVTTHASSRLKARFPDCVRLVQ